MVTTVAVVPKSLTISGTGASTLVVDIVAENPQKARRAVIPRFWIGVNLEYTSTYVCLVSSCSGEITAVVVADIGRIEMQEEREDNAAGIKDPADIRGGLLQVSNSCNCSPASRCSESDI